MAQDAHMHAHFASRNDKAHYTMCKQVDKDEMIGALSARKRKSRSVELESHTTTF